MADRLGLNGDLRSEIPASTEIVRAVSSCKFALGMPVLG